MSDETQVIEENNELVPAPVEEKKTKKSRAAAAVAAGLAGGVGAIAYDANAEELERLVAPSDSKTTPEVAPSDSSNSDKPVPQDSVPNENHPAPAPAPEPSNPGQPDVQLLPDHVHVLNASENMTFAEAFDWARETAGPAQLFEWNGQLYHTCNPGEYAALPQDMKDVFETLWLANEADDVSVITALEDEVIYNIDIDENTNQLWITEDLDVANPPVPAPVEASVQPDSVKMDTESGDFVYTEEDFDNNFDGTDEWVNPDDDIA